MSNETKTRNTKNIIITLAMITVLAAAGISAYFTATDSKTNTFTVGSIEIKTNEPDWTPDKDDDGDGVPDVNEVTPNHEYPKNPKIENTGENDAYGYMMVAVPKKIVRVSVTSTGDQNTSNLIPEAGTNEPALVGGVPNTANPAGQMTQLFQLNEKKGAAGAVNAASMQNDQNGSAHNGSWDGAHMNMQPLTTSNAANNATSWTGIDTFNDSDWYLLAVNPATGNNEALSAYKDTYNIYLYAYAKSSTGTAAELTRIAGMNRKNNNKLNGLVTETPALFESVTFANVVNINDVITGEDSIDYDSKLEGTTPQILVKSFAIQADNITMDDTADAGSVWNILNNQDGAYNAFADELHDLSTGWQAAAVESNDFNSSN